MADDEPYDVGELVRLARHHVSARWSGVDAQMQDELVAEFITSAWLASQRIREGESGRSFVWRTGAGSLKNFYRKTKKLRDTSVHDSDLAYHEAPNEDEDSRELTEQRLCSMRVFLKLLPAKDSELVERVYGVGRERETMTEVAAERGVSVAAISQRLSMLRDRLRTLIEEDVG